MKSLVEVNKNTILNLVVYDILDDIEKSCNKWFEETFIEPKDYISNDILISNLKDDLDYLLSKAIWLIELGDSLGLSMDVKEHLEYTYNLYIAKEDGYKNLVTDSRYDSVNNKVLSRKETKGRQKRINETMERILKELLP